MKFPGVIYNHVEFRGVLVLGLTISEGFFLLLLCYNIVEFLGVKL